MSEAGTYETTATINEQRSVALTIEAPTKQAAEDALTHLSCADFDHDGAYMMSVGDARVKVEWTVTVDDADLEFSDDEMDFEPDEDEEDER